jgi:PST family polysaccharide transporter
MSRLLTFGRDLSVTQIVLGVSAHLDSVLIGRLAGPVELGWYRQASVLMRQPIERLNAPIQTIAQPGLSVLQSQPARYRRYYERILFVIGLATIPLGVFTAIYAREIILVALGPEWLGATDFLRIFAVIATIQPSAGSSSMVLLTRGRSGRFLVMNLVYSATLLSLMLVGGQWGALGIASARAIALFLVIPWALSYCLADTPVSVTDFVRTLSKPIVASLAMAACLVTFRHVWEFGSAPISLTIGSGMALLAYFLVFALLPGGLAELRSLPRELIDALQRRSSQRA